MQANSDSAEIKSDGVKIKVDWNEEETCVDCTKALGYPKATDIALRPFYVRGHGDHCKKCFGKCPFAKLFIES